VFLLVSAKMARAGHFVSILHTLNTFKTWSTENRSIVLVASVIYSSCYHPHIMSSSWKEMCLENSSRTLFWVAEILRLSLQCLYVGVDIRHVP
jgi:hypothetical protein